MDQSNSEVIITPTKPLSSMSVGESSEFLEFLREVRFFSSPLLHVERKETRMGREELKQRLKEVLRKINW